jgi:predicted RNase H-like nuclease (RuvC/YqgF family)
VEAIALPARSGFVLFEEKQERRGGRMRVIGIDPGLRRTGWGVVDAVGSRLSHVANGVCASRGESLAERLLSLFEQLGEAGGPRGRGGHRT